MSPEKKEAKQREGAGLSTPQKVFVGLFGATLIGSVIARIASGSSSEETPAQPATDGTGNELASGLVAPEQGGASFPGTPGAGAVAEEPSALEEFLPYLTEGSFFGLMGFAVGYATRKIVKVLLIVVALGFLAVQLMSSQGLIDVDWGGVVGVLNEWIFNLKENQTLTEVLTDRVPTSGAFLLGVVLGFKRG